MSLHISRSSWFTAENLSFHGDLGVGKRLHGGSRRERKRDRERERFTTGKRETHTASERAPGNSTEMEQRQHSSTARGHTSGGRGAAATGAQHRRKRSRHREHIGFLWPFHRTPCGHRRRGGRRHGSGGRRWPREGDEAHGGRARAAGAGRREATQDRRSKAGRGAAGGGAGGRGGAREAEGGELGRRARRRSATVLGGRRQIGRASCRERVFRAV